MRRDEVVELVHRDGPALAGGLAVASAGGACVVLVHLAGLRRPGFERHRPGARSAIGHIIEAARRRAA